MLAGEGSKTYYEANAIEKGIDFIYQIGIENLQAWGDYQLT